MGVPLRSAAFEVFKHGGGDFGVSWPVAPPLAGVCLVCIQAVGIGLSDLPVLQKQQTHLAGWHPRDESLSLVEGTAKARRYVRGIDRLTHDQSAPIGRRIVGVPPDLGNQALGRETRRFFN
jgi:hypothetical protein